MQNALKEFALPTGAIAAHSPEEQERREALALAGLLIALSNRKPNGGAA